MLLFMKPEKRNKNTNANANLKRDTVMKLNLQASWLDINIE